MDLREEENWIKPDKIVSGYWELLEVFFEKGYFEETTLAIKLAA